MLRLQWINLHALLVKSISLALLPMLAWLQVHAPFGRMPGSCQSLPQPDNEAARRTASARI